MVEMFDNKKTNPEIIRNLKSVFTEKFYISKDSTISVAELRCHEPNCPPVETVFTVRTTDGLIKDWRISKSVSEIQIKDIELLYEKEN
mgnify:FL=1